MMSFQLCLCLAPFLSAANPLESSSLENVAGLIAVGFAIDADETRLSEPVELQSTSAIVEPESAHKSSPFDRSFLGHSLSLTVLHGDQDDDHEEDEDDHDSHQDKKKKDKKKDVEKSAKREHKHSGKSNADRGPKSRLPMGPRMSHRGPGPRPPSMHSGPPFGMTRRAFGRPGSPLQHKPFAKDTPFLMGRSFGVRSFGGPFNGPKGSH